MNLFFRQWFSGNHTRGVLVPDGTRVIDTASSQAIGMSILDSRDASRAYADVRLWASAADLLAMSSFLSLTFARFHHLETCTHPQIVTQLVRLLNVPQRTFTRGQLEAADLVFRFLYGRADDVAGWLHLLPDTQEVDGKGGAL